MKTSKLYPGEVGMMYQVSYSWLSNSGGEPYCAWCGVKSSAIGDPKKHFEWHKRKHD